MSLPTNFKSSAGFDANGQKVLNLADATNATDALNLRTFDAKNTVAPYNQAKTYAPDFIVEYAGQLWKCIGATSGLFDKSKWTAIRGTENWIRITGAYTAVPMDSLIVDTASVPLSITLPATPKSGDYVHILDAGNADVNNITVIRNGSTIDGQAADMVVNDASIQLTLVYLGGTWVLNIDRIKRIKILSGAATVKANYVYSLNVTNASFAVTLPLNPKVGDWVTLIDQNTAVGSYPITVNGNSKQIDGNSTFLFKQRRGAYQFIYTGSQWTAFQLSGNDLQADKNLSDLVDASIARGNLGLGSVATYTVGTADGQIRLNSQNDLVYQKLDQTLTAIAALVTSADKLIYSTGLDTFAITDFPLIARQLLAATNQAGQRTVMGLGTASTRDVGTAATNLMQVGAFGLGGASMGGGVDINTYTTSGMYLTPSTGVLNLPSGWPDGRNSVVVSGALPYVTQIIIQTPTNVSSGTKMAFRVGTATDTWSVWNELGVAAGLGTAASRNVGVAAGNLIEVGNAFGWGPLITQQIVPDVDAAMTPGMYQVRTGTTVGTLPLTLTDGIGGSLLVTAYRSEPGGASNFIEQKLTFTKLGTPMIRIFVRRYGQDSWEAWSEILTTANTGNVLYRNVGTAATNVMEVGAFGLGSSSTSYSGDLNAILTTQFTYVTTAATNTPAAGMEGILTHIQAKDGFGSQEFISFGITYRRYLTSSTWSGWIISSADSTGEIVVSSTNFPLQGTLKANGAAISRTVYAKLFSRIGTTFGAGDGSTTFNLPDLRGEVIRGWDDGRGIDTGRDFGSLQLDQVQGFTYEIYSGTVAGSGGSNNTRLPDLTSNTIKMPANTIRGPVTDGTNGTPRIGTETRARNVALLFCIRY